MKKTLQASIFALLIICLQSHNSFGQQTCSVSLSSSTDLSTLTSTDWSISGTGSLTTTDCVNIMNGTETAAANFAVDLANGITITISKNVTVTGNFDIPSGATGDNTTLTVSGGHTLHVTGDLGDASNNNVTYNVPSSSDHIQVDGTLYGKNGNDFTGSGTIGGNHLNLKNNAACSSPCPVTGHWNDCSSDGGANTFCGLYVPITLSFFEATVDDQIIKLKWATDSEINFDHFLLERSNNGRNFSELAKIKGAGFSNTRKDYSYTDNNPLIGNSYYRLTSIDFDGYTEVFGKSVVRVTVNAGKNFFIVPNPIEGNKLKGGVNFDTSNSQVVIYDRMGVIIDQYMLTGTQFELQLPNLGNGIYFAQLQSEEYTKSVRFVVGQ